MSKFKIQEIRKRERLGPEARAEQLAKRKEWLKQYRIKKNDVIICYRTEEPDGLMVPCSPFTFMEYQSELVPLKVIRRVAGKVFFLATIAEIQAKSKFYWKAEDEVSKNRGQEVSGGNES
jgi:hypothetical protein